MRASADGSDTRTAEQRAIDVALGPEPGWTSTDPLLALQSARNYVHDDPYGERVRIRYYRDGGVGGLVTKLWFGPGAEGPPGHAHGGALLAVLDEVAGGTVWVNGYRVVLARLESDMRKPVPLGKVLICEGAIQRIEGRKIYSDGIIRDGDGVVYVEARGLFVQLRPEQAAAFEPHATQPATEKVRLADSASPSPALDDPQ